MQFVNLTPHDLTIFLDDEDNTLTVEKSGLQARCATKRIVGDPLDRIPTFKVEFGEVVGLPEPEEGTIYVVSSLVRGALGDQRPDVLAVGEPVRDDQGRVIGCRGLSR